MKVCLNIHLAHRSMAHIPCTKNLTYFYVSSYFTVFNFNHKSMVMIHCTVSELKNEFQLGLGLVLLLWLEG